VTIFGSEVDEPASGEAVRRSGIASVVVCVNAHFVRAKQCVDVEIFVDLVVEDDDQTCIQDVDDFARRVEAQSSEEPGKVNSEELIPVLELHTVFAPGEESAFPPPVGVGAAEVLG